MVTINDIAKHTKFSRSTVAAVLSGRGEALRIKLATRKIITENAAELGYHRNSLAFQMSKGKTNVIGFLSADIAVAEFTGSILSGIMRESAADEYYAKIFSYVSGNPEKTLARIVEQRPAGVIAFAVLQPDFNIIADGLNKFGIPLLSLNDVKANHGIFVVTDDSAGIGTAIDHLYTLGHRKIGFFDAQKSVALKEPRSEGFLHSVTKYNLSEAKIITELIDNPGLETLAHVIAKKSYTAIVCSTDYFAMQILQAAVKVGVKVPEELSVIGFADLFSSRFCSPPLTTVQQPFIRWGMVAARKLLNVINDKSKFFLNEKIIEKIPLELIVRESTAPVPNRKNSGAKDY